MAHLLLTPHSPSPLLHPTSPPTHRLGQIDAAWSVLQDMTAAGAERTPATYMLLLQAAEVAGRWRTALDSLDGMAASGLRLTPQAYAAAVGACAAG